MREERRLKEEEDLRLQKEKEYRESLNKITIEATSAEIRARADLNRKVI